MKTVFLKFNCIHCRTSIVTYSLSSSSQRETILDTIYYKLRLVTHLNKSFCRKKNVVKSISSLIFSDKKYYHVFNNRFNQ